MYACWTLFQPSQKRLLLHCRKYILGIYQLKFDQNSYNPAENETNSIVWTSRCHLQLPDWFDYHLHHNGFEPNKFEINIFCNSIGPQKLNITVVQQIVLSLWNVFLQSQLFAYFGSFLPNLMTIPWKFYSVNSAPATD